MNTEDVWQKLRRRFTRLKTCRNCVHNEKSVCQVSSRRCLDNAKADFCPDGRYEFIPGMWPSGFHNEALYQATIAAPPPEPDSFSRSPHVHFGAHLWPVIHNEAPHKPWLWHLSKWEELSTQINGRCLVGVATGPDTAPFSEIRSLLSDRFELFELPNHKVEGENLTFRELLKRLPHGSDDVLIYAHGKGVQGSRYRSEAVRLWTELLYETVVFNWEEAIRRLSQGYKAFGSFRSFTTALNVIPHGWYYSGTFFITRLKHMKGKPVSPIWGGVEHFLGTHFPAHECWLEFADARDLGQEYYMDRMFPDTVMEGFNWETHRIGGVHCEQHKRELDWFLRQLRPDDRILVIGSRRGGLEYQINLRYPDAETVSVDCDPMDGNNRRLIVGSSHDPAIQRQVRALGDFDVVFIDGDHSHAGVSEDWELALKFRPRLIAFHDIADTTLHRRYGCRVDLLWSQIQRTHKTRQMVVGCGWGGIGVVDLEAESRCLIGPTTVSIIITARPQDDRFIDRAYQSAIEQGREVVVVWDSCQIPDRYRDKPLQISANFGDVSKARYAGFQAASGSIVLYLEADDILPPSFVADATNELVNATQEDDRVAGVYPEVDHIDEETTIRSTEKLACLWGKPIFECDNVAVAFALVWAHALRVAWHQGGGGSNSKGLGVWSCLTASGWRLMPCPNLRLQAPSHVTSISHFDTCERCPDDNAPSSLPVTVFATVSGRMHSWTCLKDWLMGLPSTARLVLCDRSGNTEFAKQIRSVYWSIDDVRIYSDSRKEDSLSEDDCDCAVYNRAFQEIHTPFTFVMDDELIPQMHASTALRELMEGFSPGVSAVFGFDQNRYRDTSYQLHRYVDVKGTGLRCVLARTRILQVIPQASPAWTWTDSWFWKRVHSRGYKVRLSTRTPCSRSDRTVLIICYHDLDPVERNPWTLHPDRFQSQLREIIKRGYKVMTLADAIRTDEERVAVITFDDGRAGCFTYGRKILADLNVQACFYVCPGFIDGNPPKHECYSRFMDWSQVKTLASDGHLIGSHSMTHRHMGKLSSDQIRNELIQSRESLERNIPQVNDGCRHFALPYGEGGCLVSDLAEECGYSTVVTTESTLNNHPLNLLGLGRLSVQSPCSSEQFINELTQLEIGSLN
jgi:peptidoglycan/xylan/chitin deacetylase (PgdA/CDA1 family)